MATVGSTATLVAGAVNSVDVPVYVGHKYRIQFLPKFVLITDLESDEGYGQFVIKCSDKSALTEESLARMGRVQRPQPRIVDYMIKKLLPGTKVDTFERVYEMTGDFNAAVHAQEVELELTA